VTFTIGCRYRDYDKKSFTVEKETAAEALETVENLQRSDVTIEYIDTPAHARLDLWGFRTLYKGDS